MSDPSWPVQMAIHDKVAQAMGTIPVLDAVPENQGFPYLVIGDDTLTAAATKSEDAHQMTVTIHAWSRSPGRKECKTLLAGVYDALHGRDLEIEGYDVTAVRFEYGDSFLDADGRTWHGVARYRIIVE